MPNLLSPGVNITEYDYSNIIPAVSSTATALGGVFSWGPIEERQLIANERQYAIQYGRPNDNNFETWFTGANFLSYGSTLYVSRAAANAFNSVAGTADNALAANATSGVLIKNQNDFIAQSGAVISGNGNNYYVAKWAGVLGNTLKISVCENANQYSSVLASPNSSINVAFSFAVGSNVATLSVTAANGSVANTAANNIINSLIVGDYIQGGNSTIGTQSIKVSGLSNSAIVLNANVATNTAIASISLSTIYTLSSNVTQNTATRFWEYAGLVNKAPNTTPYVAQRGGAGDELHVVVVDQDGLFSGVVGEVLETWPSLSRATDALGEQGGSIYYATFLNASSQYVWWASDRGGAISNTTVNIIPSANPTPLTLSFVGGSDGQTETTLPISNWANAYNQFISAEDVDISILMTGKSRGGINGEQTPNYLIDNIALQRKDCVVTLSPNRESVVNNFFAPEAACVNFKANVRDQSYSFMDSGYKYQYDKYNDIYRYIPLNGDTAGLMAYTDSIRDPWWSPAGFNRGFIRNVVKLAWNPNKTQRDILYQAGINPVVTFPAVGTVLFGDKTCLTAPSAFSRINVRRLFIVLEKAIGLASQYELFEFNDPFTRAQFVNMVEPYLRDIKGRRGIYDFKVVCDDTNNPGSVEDLNYFVGDIYIKPAKSINFIALNFIATTSSIDFSYYNGTSPGI